jgi:hypothetical protein
MRLQGAIRDEPGAIDGCDPAKVGDRLLETLEPAIEYVVVNHAQLS